MLVYIQNTNVLITTVKTGIHFLKFLSHLIIIMHQELNNMRYFKYYNYFNLKHFTGKNVLFLKFQRIAIEFHKHCLVI